MNAAMVLPGGCVIRWAGCLPDGGKVYAVARHWNGIPSCFGFCSDRAVLVPVLCAVSAPAFVAGVVVVRVGFRAGDCRAVV